MKKSNKPSIDDILRSMPPDQIKLVWYTDMPKGSEILYGFLSKKSFNIEICRNCGLNGVHVKYAPNDMVGLSIDIEKYVHVEVELEDGYAVMSECSLNPNNGLWQPYTNTVFAKRTLQ